PYEKYFFVGGSNSVRAWRPRRLGVGSRPPPLTTDPSADGLFDYRFEQPGDILLEASVELRKKLFGFVHGAFFVDVGNVWTVREQNYVPTENAASWTGTTKFKLSDFVNQLGVGTGLGVRFDFSFLVFRFDVGVKVYDPAREQGDRFVLNRAKAFGDFTDREPMIFNIGVGYPF
ncbi:MAG: BamA/TamA family outer membrane protein, partial [Cyclobacteriaceae bacterium]